MLLLDPTTQSPGLRPGPPKRIYPNASGSILGPLSFGPGPSTYVKQCHVQKLLVMSTFFGPGIALETQPWGPRARGGLCNQGTRRSRVLRAGFRVYLQATCRHSLERLVIRLKEFPPSRICFEKTSCVKRMLPTSATGTTLLWAKNTNPSVY